MNVYTVYAFSSNLNNFVSTLENCLFGAVKWTKNTDIDKSKYILGVVLDLIHVEIFYFLVVNLLKM